MKRYFEPAIKFIAFTSDDVITTSTLGDPTDPRKGDWFE